MLSTDDVTPTLKINDDALVTSSCRRSSVSCDQYEKDSASLTRWGSFRGSMSTLAPGVGAGAPHWRTESIVEALEKKCRENVSSRLRNHLPQHLRMKSSTTACVDLPVIVRASTSSLSRPSSRTRGGGEPPGRSSCQLYQTVTEESSPLHCAERRHSTTTTMVWTPDLPSLSRQLRRGSDDAVQQQAESESTSSASERSSTSREDSDQTANKRATLPARLHPGLFHETGPPQPTLKHQSTSSASTPTVVRSSTTNEDSKQPAAVETCQCDKPRLMLRQGSGDTLDQSDATSAPWPLTRTDQDWAATDKRGASLPARLQPKYDHLQYVVAETPSSGFSVGSTSSMDSDVTADCDVNSESSDVDSDSCDEVSVSSFTFSRSTTEARERNPSSAVLLDRVLANGSDAVSKELNVDGRSGVDSASLRDRELRRIKASANTALYDRRFTSEAPASTVTSGSVGTREDDNGGGMINETTGTTHGRLNGGWSCNGQISSSQPVLASSKDIATQSSKSVGESKTTSTEDRSCGKPRFRTSISLSISTPAVSAATTKLVCRSNAVESRQFSVNRTDLSSSPSPPPLPLSTQPDLDDSKPSKLGDNWLENDGEFTYLSVDGRQCNGDSGGPKTTDQRRSNADEPERLSSTYSVLFKSHDDFTPATSATETFSDFAPTSRPQFSAARIATNGVTNGRHWLQTRLSNHVTAADLVSRSATINNGHVLTTQKSERVGTSQNSTLADQWNNRPAADDDHVCRKNSKDAALANGSPRTVVAFQTGDQQMRETGRSHFECQINGGHGVLDDRSPELRHTRESRVERPHLCTVTSSVVVISGSSGPRRPISVIDTPVTSQREEVGRSSESGMFGPSVERSWETMRTDSTRVAFIPRKTSIRRVSTSEPQDEPLAVIPIQRANDLGHGQSSPLTDRCTLHATNSAEDRVRSQSLDQLVDVVVMKSGLALGFSIDGGADSTFGDRPVTVKKVFRDDVTLRPGDELLSANGRPLRDLSHFVALNFLKSLPDGPVHLAVRRNSTSGNN